MDDDTGRRYYDAKISTVTLNWGTKMGIEIWENRPTWRQCAPPIQTAVPDGNNSVCTTSRFMRMYYVGDRVSSC